jgi:beta-N-acetylhexosaminidase
LHRRIGQLAIVGFEGYAIPPELVALAREFDLAGILLFKRNVESPEQVAEVALRAKDLARELPLWVSVDQEGGRVARLRAPLTEWPPVATLGRAGRDDLAARFARALALELAVVGFSLDFAPVLDVLTSSRNPAIGDRAIADEAETVGRLGAVIARELQGRAVASCGKHFPGHGDTTVDSHLELPVVEHPPERFREIDFPPFRAAIEADIAGIMVGHLLVPAFDEQRPASLSPAIVEGVLRQELGFEGLVFTDDMEMKAISAHHTRERAAVGAIAAGCDTLLLCGTDIQGHAAALEAIVHAVEREELPYKRVEDALARQHRAKGRFASVKPWVDEVSGRTIVPPLRREWRPLPPPVLREILGRDEHQSVADEMKDYL